MGPGSVLENARAEPTPRTHGVHSIMANQHVEAGILACKRVLRAGLRGVLIADRHPAAGYFPACEVAYIFDPKTGEIVLPMDVEPAKVGHGVLCVPVERPDATQMTLEWSACGEDEIGHAADRWAGYHGKTSKTRWARGMVRSVKRSDSVYTCEQIDMRSQLLGVEGELRKLLNNDRSRLAMFVRAKVGVEANDALAVGIDELGIDVRTGFGVVRVEFDEPMQPEHAAESVRGILGVSGGPGGDGR